MKIKLDGYRALAIKSAGKAHRHSVSTAILTSDIPAPGGGPAPRPAHSSGIAWPAKRTVHSGALVEPDSQHPH